MYSIKMSVRTLKIGNIETNKKEFHNFKQPFNLNLVDINKTLKSDKFKHTDDGFKYFIGYKDDNIIRFCLEWVGTWNVLKTEEKTCLLWLKMITYWLNIMKLGIQFHSQLVDDEKYIKAKSKDLMV